MIRRLHKDSMSMYSHLKKQRNAPSFPTINEGTLSVVESRILRAVDPMEIIEEILSSEEFKRKKPVVKLKCFFVLLK